MLLLLIIVGCKKHNNDSDGPYSITIITTADLQSQVLPQKNIVNSEHIAVGGMAREIEREGRREGKHCTGLLPARTGVTDVRTDEIW